MSQWKAVCRTEPCEICGYTKWCSRSGDVVRCMKVSEPPPGWRIVKRCRDRGVVFGPLDRNRRPPHSARPKERPRITPPDWAAMYSRFTKNLRPGRLAMLAGQLGVCESSLLDLGVGWDGHAYTFPMRAAGGAIIGIRRRFPDGRKRAVKGSRNGLFLPNNRPDEGMLFIAEGESDTAALLDLGVTVIGRPGCGQCIDFCLDLVSGRDVVIVADNDRPGREGAESLRDALLSKAGTVKIIFPGPPFNDIREEVRSGLTRDVLLQRVAEAPCQRPPSIVSPPLSLRHRWYAPERTRKR